ncbi:Pachytene checkpoint [Hyphodiscus hymeniophilus]|uniref:Pachytene checkpoint n=1 Tax=Hyphodiscus hymeniophilus TaxID=353542 RepID=A0A9P7AZM8_9HELO|nr:Pachytene checkpoint [Hyphodiscus hymeniophilus]
MEKSTSEDGISGDEEGLLEGDYEIVTTKKRGTIFIEARIRDELEDEVDVATRHLEEQLSRPNQTFSLFTNLLSDEYGKYKYSGPTTDIKTYRSDDVHIKVQVYQLYHTRRSTEEQDGLPQADVTPLPHIKFEGQWDELFFENDIKGDLIWMMTNILRFSQASGREPGDTNPLMLLYGPPGTGKTTLCQGLAQKISIRLNLAYKRTRLIQIKAAALLSKYYSESAKQVDKIFITLQRMCEDDSEEFICVLIDEVETIAITRQASAHGESQESLRATNAFLTGLDRTKTYPNIIFLCTSNMVDSLDAAFIDRCGLKIEVGLPSLASQYAILRGRIQKLITRGIVLSKAVLPSYRDAEIERILDSDLPGSKIIHILGLIKSNQTTHESREGQISGRSLTQLPEQALLRYLRGEDCDLDLVLELIEKYVKAGQARGVETSIDANGEDPPDGLYTEFDDILKTGEKTTSGVGPGGRKRTFTAVSKEDHALDQALEALGECFGAMSELIAGLRER